MCITTRPNASHEELKVDFCHFLIYLESPAMQKDTLCGRIGTDKQQ